MAIRYFPVKCPIFVSVKTDRYCICRWTHKSVCGITKHKRIKKTFLSCAKRYVPIQSRHWLLAVLVANGMENHQKFLFINIAISVQVASSNHRFLESFNFGGAIGLPGEMKIRINIYSCTCPRGPYLVNDRMSTQSPSISDALILQLLSCNKSCNYSKIKFMQWFCELYASYTRSYFLNLCDTSAWVRLEVFVCKEHRTS